MFSRLIGLMAVVPVSVLLTISFFVLFVLRKVEDRALKVFGQTVAVLLWLAASIILACGLYVLITGKHLMICPMMEMMKAKHHMMAPKMQEERQMLFREQTPGRPMYHEKQSKEIKQEDSGGAGNKGIVTKAQ